jgi:hypothetical protein
MPPSALGAVGVLFGELMPVLAMRFGRLSSDDGVPTQGIDSRRDGFEVIRIDAESVAAQVVDLHANRDRSDKCLVRDSVCDRVAVWLCEGYLSVSAIGDCGVPLPAARLGRCRESADPIVERGRRTVDLLALKNWH